MTMLMARKSFVVSAHSLVKMVILSDLLLLRMLFRMGWRLAFFRRADSREVNLYAIMNPAKTPRELAKIDPDYSLLLDHLAALIRVRGTARLPLKERYRDDAQVLSIKLFKHLFSARQLSEGSTYSFKDGQEFDHVDWVSITVIVRAAFEAYLMFHYIFGGADEQVNRFRHACWACDGLTARQRYAANTESSRVQIAEELPELRAVQALIQSLPEFQRYSPKQQAKLVEGHWDVIREETSFAAIAESAGISRKYFEDIYSYLSGFAHSSYASTLQIREAQTGFEQQQTLAFTSMRMACLIAAKLVCDLRKHLPVPDDIEPDEETSKVILMWAERFNLYLNERWGKGTSA
jgi:hypothetical protein